MQNAYISKASLASEPGSPASGWEIRGRLPARGRTDAAPMIEIRRVFEANFCVDGVRKGWWQLVREEIVAARYTVARLMSAVGLAGWCGARRNVPLLQDTFVVHDKDTPQ